MNIHVFCDIADMWKLRLRISMKNHCGSIIILKIVNDPLRVWTENHIVPVLPKGINKRLNRILLVDYSKHNDDHGKVAENIWKDIL